MHFYYIKFCNVYKTKPEKMSRGSPEGIVDNVRTKIREKKEYFCIPDLKKCVDV